MESKWERKKIGLRIAALRRMKGLDQTSLARIVKVSQSKISKIEMGVLMLTIPDAAILLGFFQVPVERFIRGIYLKRPKNQRK